VQERVDELMDEAWECLGSYETERAFEIGKELLDMRFSGGFEILALAHLQQEEIDEAIQILEEGTRKAQQVWRLWQLLGNCYSDVDRFNDAMRAYEQALAADDPDESQIHLNIAISLSRMGQHERSNAELTYVTSEETKARAAAIRVGNYADLQRWQAVLEEAPRAVAQLEEHEDEYSAEDIGRILGRLSQALYETGNQKEAFDTARRALLLMRRNEIAMKVIRLCKARSIEDGDDMFRIMTQGKWFEPFEDDEEIPEFYKNYMVLAKDVYQALEFAREIEPDGVGETLQLSEFKRFPTDAPLDFRGVYAQDGYIFYGSGEEDAD
jgi:tetratricopeptide (TPR) repeat protein